MEIADIFIQHSPRFDLLAEQGELFAVAMGNGGKRRCPYAYTRTGCIRKGMDYPTAKKCPPDTFTFPHSPGLSNPSLAKKKPHPFG